MMKNGTIEKNVLFEFPPSRSFIEINALPLTKAPFFFYKSKIPAFIFFF